ncbi:MAG TPA: ankyrin repeat domain-containing protein [Thermoanaerobaculia bacterium]
MTGLHVEYAHFLGICAVVSFAAFWFAAGAATKKRMRIASQAKPHPLHEATLDPDLLRVVLQKGVGDIDERTASGMTPLLYLLQHADLPDVDQPLYVRNRVTARVTEAAKLLLEAGADPHVQLESGMTAMRLAQMRGFSEVEELLAARGVSRQPPPLHAFDVDALAAREAAAYDGFGPAPGTVRWNLGLRFARFISAYVNANGSERLKEYGCLGLILLPFAIWWAVVSAIWWLLFR